ncbi:MAG: lipopolysaccharide assembly protein LapB [Betaproteobacteria bacterium]|nr:lipopolysaccharide assembly protein LapB [Betaproteobacteria bacterium]
MDFDPILALLGLPLAFVLGWLASRFDLRQLRLDNRQAPKAYFKGLNFLLNEQQDQAIDAFIEAVQNDPDTSDLHFALGNLFRRRGEYERAVRVHQHLLSRGDLGQDERHRAQHALALDYLKAGLLDRAEEALLALEGTRFEAEARLALLANYERSRDWAGAARVARLLEGSDQGSFSIRRAHYLCEQAAEQKSGGTAEQAHALLQEAIATAPEAARARMALAELQSGAGDSQRAWDTLRQALEQCPAAAPLIAPTLAQAAVAADRVEPTLGLLEDCYATTPALDVLDAIVTLQSRDATRHASARERYALHLEKEPSLVAAAKWIAGEVLSKEQFHPHVQRALDHAVKPLSRYRCMACGFEATRYFWQCPGCQAWDSYPARRIEEL